MLGRRRSQREPQGPSPPAPVVEALGEAPGATIRAQRDALVGDHALGGAEFCAAYSALADRWLVALLSAAAAAGGGGGGGGGPEGVALVAVGGFGRSELAPGSDLDILLIHRGRKDRDIKPLAERLWYPLWDAGVKLGHGVRSLKEALALAAGDLDTATSLLTARHVAGDPDVTATLAAGAAEQWQARSTRWLGALGDAVVERHRKAGEVAFLLEPDLKEGRGGLRDVHAQHWAEAARRILLEGDDEALGGAYRTLLGVRVALHRHTAKASDHLVLQDQDAVAAQAGYPDADTLMAAVAGAARTIAWTSDETWHRIASSLRGPTGRSAPADRHLGSGLVLRDGVVHLTAEADLPGDGTLI
ncbi:MAG: [protein-PII] uridylyltransferase, partial [Acidimicrobiia bacterium]